MRSHGVPNFPDPDASGGFSLGPGSNPQSPAFESAQTTCQKLFGGPPSPGSTTHPTAATMAQILNISRCMRRHGISDFPDPTTSMPSNMADFQYVSDRDGAILAFPRGFDEESPQFTRAAAACGFKLTNHRETNHSTGAMGKERAAGRVARRRHQVLPRTAAR